jgi:phosphoglucomutase
LIHQQRREIEFPFLQNVLEREALMLESVTIAVQQGADFHAVNGDGRIALDAARALKMESVMKFLTDRGARSGK